MRAHVFDNFANHFISDYHVYGITRRGWGLSSQPDHGYEVATRALDDIKVMDALGIEKAVIVGHSISGDEVSALGADYPERVEALVYLDALDFGEHAKLEQPPFPDYADEDLTSVARFTAANARTMGFRAPLSSLSGVYRFSPDGAVVAPVSSPEIAAKLVAGSKQAEFARIQRPALGIFVPLSVTEPLLSYHYLTSAQQAEYDRVLPALVEWQRREIERFRAEVKNSTVIELPGANHYLFIEREGFVVLQMRRFLQQFSRR